MRWRRGKQVDESGVELVELALAVLPLTLVVMGAIDLGRVFILSSQLRQAAEAGALYAQDYPTQVAPSATDPNCADPNNITYQVASAQGYSSSSSLPSNETVAVTDLSTSPTATVTGCQTGTVAAGDTVEVEVSAPFSPITPLISSITGPITLHATVEVVAQ